MAERRMFSKKVVGSAKFLKMPISSQALYFHLGLNADDDGIVEAFTVMRQTGATEDDLKILVAKEFTVVLNEDLVTFITDWSEHNTLRADRKIDSIYKNLLLKIIPNANLLEMKKRADTKSSRIRTDIGRTMDGIGKDRLVEVSIGKDSIEESNIHTHSQKNKFGHYNNVLLTDAEHTKLLGQVDGNDAIEFLSEYREMKGYKVKSDYLAIKNWVFSAVKERRQKEEQLSNKKPCVTNCVETPLQQLSRVLGGENGRTC